VLKNPANSKRAVSLSPQEFHHTLTNTLTEEESRRAYDQYAAPTPGRVFVLGRPANSTPDAATTYDFANDDRAPLLFISGGSHHVLPPAVHREDLDAGCSRISPRSP
jgi:hypothetical protein